MTGRLASTQQVTVYERAQSWAFELHDKRDPQTIAFCRVPLKPGEEQGFAPGDRVHATGVLLADGAANGLTVDKNP